MRKRTPFAVRRAARRTAARQAANGTDRQQALTRFGPAADERTSDRRQPRSPAETERILRELGIQDRRRQERRR